MISDPRSNKEAMLSLLSPAMPLSPIEQANEKYGKGETMLRRLGNLFTGGLFDSVLMPELSNENRAQYKTDMELYKAQQAAMFEAQLASQASQAERERMSGLHSNLREAWATDGLEDDIEMGMAAIAGGMDREDLKFFQKMAGHSVGDEKWEKIEINGDYYYKDANNPNSQPIPVTMDDGTIASKAVDGDTRKTSGWFKRAVPALENMHKLEDRGVTLPREALLLTQQAQNADGFFDKQLYDQLLNRLSLSDDQKQYLRNAQDLAMIQLRKESGAAIGVQEMFNELNQNVMLNDMNDEAYAYQRGSRANKYRGLADGLAESVIRDFKSQKLFERMDKLRSSSERVLIKKAEEGNQEAADELLRRLVEEHRASQLPEQPLIYRSSGNQ